MLSGSANVKAVRRMLMKLSPGWTTCCQKKNLSKCSKDYKSLVEVDKYTYRKKKFLNTWFYFIFCETFEYSGYSRKYKIKNLSKVFLQKYSKFAR